MWTRKELKTRAKEVLRTTYWKAFLVSFVLAAVGGFQGCSFNSEFSGGGDPFAGGWEGIPVAVVIGIIFVVVFIVLLGLAYQFFLYSPLEVGVRQYFKQSAQNDVNMNYLGFSFNKGKYLSIVKGMLWKNVLNFLWFLLLIIPGIVKAYSYSMVPYILADNPWIGTRRAVELSNQMTKGEKWKMFVLDLSFIGWYLLGTLACFVGILFVLPYMYATHAELYLTLRQKAFDLGLCSKEELGVTELY